MNILKQHTLRGTVSSPGFYKAHVQDTYWSSFCVLSQLHPTQTPNSNPSMTISFLIGIRNEIQVILTGQRPCTGEGYGNFWQVHFLSGSLSLL